MQASDRLYYFYQAVQDAEEVLQSSDEGRTAAQQASDAEVGLQSPGLLVTAGMSSTSLAARR